MQEYQLLLSFFTNVLFVMALGWYLITNLQWYDYKLTRVVLKHHKVWWHIFYFVVPFVLYHILPESFGVFLAFGYLPALWLWHKKLDKKLVLTWRVKRFLIVLFVLVFLQDIVCSFKASCAQYGAFLPLILAYGFSSVVEKYLFMVYKKEAKKKLNSFKNLEIVAITGSYGKTSIKNFVAQVLATKFNVYATPRSVNTIGGIVADVNNNLKDNVEVYVAEAGARERGDIYEITSFLEPQRVVVGKVGLAHIEYFKTLENIVATKLEIMQSPKLQKAYIHTSVTDEPHPKVEFFGNGVKNVVATLQSTEFDLELDGEHVHFSTQLLGTFQAQNLEVAIKIAKSFGMSNQEIIDAVAKIKPVEHRLQRIDAGGKIILDDGYNGNIDGMLEAIRLCSLHNGRKVIVTPGLVESSDELNVKLIEAINDVFDIVIVTGSLNKELFQKHLHVKNSIFLEDKANLTDTLAKQTQSGDIILFANDAPSFI